MNINSDINVLGSIADFSVISLFLQPKNVSTPFTQSGMKTTRSYDRYKRAITNTLIKFTNKKVETIIHQIITKESISPDAMFLLFWNASYNNELLAYLNQKVFFPALYNGRSTIKKEEVIACLQELKESEISIAKWTENTTKETAQKYIHLLLSFNLLEGGLHKIIAHTHLSDKMFVLYLYWLLAIETKSNILESQWLPYCLMEKEFFIQRCIQKSFRQYFNITYSGDRLTMEPLLSYEVICDELTKS